MSVWLIASRRDHIVRARVRRIRADDIVPAHASLGDHRHVTLVEAYREGLAAGVRVVELLPGGIENGRQCGAVDVGLDMVGFVFFDEPAIGTEAARFGSVRRDADDIQSRQVPGAHRERHR